MKRLVLVCHKCYFTSYVQAGILNNEKLKFYLATGLNFLKSLLFPNNFSQQVDFIDTVNRTSM